MQRCTLELHFGNFFLEKCDKISNVMNIALIVFAGIGSRITSSVPKQFVKINNKELVVYAIEIFNEHPLIDEIVLVTSKDYLGYAKNFVYMHRLNKVNHIVEGGKNRQESVRNGLNAVNYGDNDIVLIHDGDRPFITTRLITKCIDELEGTNGVSPMIKHDDALEEVSNSGRFIFKDGVRYDVQTPQTFNYKLIKDLHNRLKDEEVSDDMSLLESLGMDVKYIEGDVRNIKITTNIDLAYAKKVLLEFKDE